MDISTSMDVLQRSRNERFKMIAAPFLILTQKINILLARRYNTGYADGWYSLPAGHVEEGETLIQTLIRETKEEIGIDIQPKHLSLVHVMHIHQEDTRLHFFFTANVWKGNPRNCEPDKCDDIQWTPIKNLPKNTIPYVRQALELYNTNVIYSEFGWND